MKYKMSILMASVQNENILTQDHIQTHAETRVIQKLLIFLPVMQI